MGVDELQSSDLPAVLKAWGAAQITKVEFNANILTEGFGDEMKRWWDGLGLRRDQEANRLLTFPWCRNGKVGIVMLVLSMHWWVDKGGARKEWMRVLKEMMGMWELIVAAPSLWVILICGLIAIGSCFLLVPRQRGPGVQMKEGK